MEKLLQYWGGLLLMTLMLGLAHNANAAELRGLSFNTESNETLVVIDEGDAMVVMGSRLGEVSIDADHDRRIAPDTSGTIVQVNAGGRSSTTTDTFRDRVGVVIRPPRAGYNKVVFLNRYSMIVAGIGLDHEEMASIVERQRYVFSAQATTLFDRLQQQLLMQTVRTAGDEILDYALTTYEEQMSHVRDQLRNVLGRSIRAEVDRLFERRKDHPTLMANGFRSLFDTMNERNAVTLAVDMAADYGNGGPIKDEEGRVADYGNGGPIKNDPLIGDYGNGGPIKDGGDERVGDYGNGGPIKDGGDDDVADYGNGGPIKDEGASPAIVTQWQGESLDLPIQSLNSDIRCEQGTFLLISRYF